MKKPRWILAAILLLVVSFARAQVVEYIHTDALGSPVAVTNASGVVIERTVYEPYGAVINRPVTNGPGYTGHVMDAVTGLNYMQQRYYDPQLGRFLSNDPVTATSLGGNFNRYWYANNNPYLHIDPDGRWATWVHRRITRTAAIQAGMTKVEANAMADQVVGVDKGTQSSRATDTVIHAMAGQLPDGSWQTEDQATEATDRYIRNTENPLENRIHAAQDSTADHHLGEIWRDPLSGTGKDLVGILRDIGSAIMHLVKDAFPSSKAEAKAVAETKELLMEKNDET